MLGLICLTIHWGLVRLRLVLINKAQKKTTSTVSSLESKSFDVDFGQHSLQSILILINIAFPSYTDLVYVPILLVWSHIVKKRSRFTNSNFKTL